MSSKSKPDWWGRIATIAPMLSVVIGLLVLVLGGGFVYNRWFNVPDLAYTILPTYRLQDQSFGGLVVENRGRATAHDVSIRVTDLASNIEQYSIDSDELWTLEEGGTGASGITIWLDRMTAGSSITIYLLTPEPIELDGLAVRAEEGPAHPAVAVSARESILSILSGAVAAMAITLISITFWTRLRSQQKSEKAAEIVFISLPYDFIEHFTEAQQGTYSGSVVRLHRNARCGEDSKRSIFEHPPDDSGKFSTLTYNLAVPSGTHPLELRGFIGIQTEVSEPGGARMSERTPDNGVQFDIFVNGRLEFREQKYTSQWEEFSIGVPRRESLSICFRTNCLGNPYWNWAVWGEPKLVEMHPTSSAAG